MKQEKPRLSIVILNYNRCQDTMYTLSKLQGLQLDHGQIEIIAVDNGSTDKTPEFLKSQSHWVKVLLLSENLGIEGLNKGFEKAIGDYIFVLDDDSHPYNKKTITLLIDLLDRYDDAGVIACRIESAHGKIERTWHLPDKDTFGESLAFVGCGFVVRRDLFKKIGWFPGHFFLYQNEIAVAIKIVQAGYKIYYEPRCRVIHRTSPNGRASWRQVFYPTRNTVWLLRQYLPFPLSLYYIFSRVCFGFLRTLQSGEYRWFFRAFLESFCYNIQKETLSPVLSKRFLMLRQQNSLLHHFSILLKSFH